MATKRTAEWLPAKEIYDLGMSVRYPAKDRSPDVSYEFDTLKQRGQPRAHKAMIAVARWVLKNFKRKSSRAKGTATR